MRTLKAPPTEKLEYFVKLVEYRLFEDLRRSWRVVQPNLEDAGLLTIDYFGLKELAADHQTFDSIPGFSDQDPELRLDILRALLDHCRRNLAINAAILNRDDERSALRKYLENNEFPVLQPDREENLRWAQKLIRPAGARLPWNAGTCFGITGRTLAGRFLQRHLNLSGEPLEIAVDHVLELLHRQGILVMETRDDCRLYQINVSTLVRVAGDGTRPGLDRIRIQRRSTVQEQINTYFQRLYQTPLHELGHLECREHTAQVVANGEREKREQRFLSEIQPRPWNWGSISRTWISSTCGISRPPPPIMPSAADAPDVRASPA